MTALRVCIVDDSIYIRRSLVRLFESEPRIKVVGTAGSGEEFLELRDQWKPEVVLLDLGMPGMGGLETLDRIMATNPIPVVILSTHSQRSACLTIESLHRGAADFIDKQAYSLVDFETLRPMLTERLLQVASHRNRSGTVSIEHQAAVTHGSGHCEIVVLGASTGGPPALERVLRDIGGRASAPIVLVQHMAAPFNKAFVERLGSRLDATVREPTSGEELRTEHVYVAPGDVHLRIKRKSALLRASLDPEPTKAPHIPAVDVLFQSAADISGSRAIGVLLTGMGRDGADGMLALRKAGAHTIAQAERGCAVYGMPRAAVECGGVSVTLSLERIGPSLRGRLAPH